MNPNKTYIIQNKETGQQWIADSGKSSWKKPSHAKNAWKGSRRNVPSQYHNEERYSWGETVRFDDQDMFEIIELKSVDLKKLERIEEIVMEITALGDFSEGDIYEEALGEIYKVLKGEC